MKRKQGFTLVELLVVIAIITILASIVTPNVLDWISRARVAKALSEVKNAELALTKMLADAGKENFKHFFAVTPMFDTLEEAEYFYTDAMYQLLRRGKAVNLNLNAKLVLRDDVRRKLGSAYMDLGKDPWGNLYRFFIGPLRSAGNTIGTSDANYRNYRMPFRIFNVDSDIPGSLNPDKHTFDTTDEDGRAIRVGFPAPNNLPVYIWSTGADMLSAQVIYEGASGAGSYNPLVDDQAHMGGGDDINNWDNAQSWAGFY